MRRQLVGVVILGSLIAASCGGEDRESANGDENKYCEVTRSIFRGQEEPPSDEEMDKWETVAPGNILSDVKLAAGAYRELNNSPEPDFASLEEEPLVSSFDRVESFNEDECGIKVE